MNFRLPYTRAKQLFALPGCYRQVRASGECPKPGAAVARDLLTLFFSYKTFPDHYGPCHLWELERDEWAAYYGSNYHIHQAARLKQHVQPPQFRILFNDKYVCVLICRALGIATPVTYGVIEPARDYQGRLKAWFEASQAGSMIIKPLYGEMGRDIVMAVKSGGDIVIRSAKQEVPLKDFLLREPAVVQEVLRQDARLAAFCPTSVNTIRVVTMIASQNHALMVNASIRTGVGDSFVDNFSAGGVSAGIVRETGHVMKYAYDRNWKRYTAHPTSGLVFENYQVPEWEKITAAAVSIQRSFPFYKLLGLDLAVSDKGEPVVIELNGAPDLVGLEQKAGPLLASEPVLRAFGEYGLLVNKHQRRLYAGLVRS